jgi:O-acetyl-ADP-ribose deacetylase (regulator of RNase III)
MAKLIEKSNIATHQAQALVFGEPDDFTTAELEALQHRYGTDLLAYYQQVKSMEGWDIGVIAPVGVNGQAVIYACVRRKGGQPSYEGVRACVQKICDKSKELGYRHIACGRLGASSGQIKPTVLEIVVSAAERNGVGFDIYDVPS